MQAALAYFTAPSPTNAMKDALDHSIKGTSLLTCSLIARFILYSNATQSKQRHRLSRMGFDASHTMLATFGLDQWVTTILATIVVSAATAAGVPGTLPLPVVTILTSAITFGLSIGCAVLGAAMVANSFAERQAKDESAYPPIAELTFAGLIVAGLSMALRVGIPLIPALIGGGDSSEVFFAFVERLPGVITPFVCTISLGLLFTYIGTRPWGLLRMVAWGAVGNGLAFMGAGLIVGSLLSDQVLAQFYAHLAHARTLIVINSGVVGFAVGGIALWAFKRSKRAREDLTQRTVTMSSAA
jgi:hypothetical protein